MKIAILGSGPCGLGVAHELNKNCHGNWPLTERNGHLGGLSASSVDDAGFTWDIGGHVLFSHYDYFDHVVEEALRGNTTNISAKAGFAFSTHWVPYPFQNNVRYLPAEARDRCVEGLKNLTGNP